MLDWLSSWTIFIIFVLFPFAVILRLDLCSTCWLRSHKECCTQVNFFMCLICLYENCMLACDFMQSPVAGTNTATLYFDCGDWFIFVMG